MVPARFVPLVAKMLLNLTLTVQLAPGANVVPVQVSDALTTTKKNVNMLPPGVEAATLVTANCAPPAGAVFVSVTIPVPDPVPAGRVISKGFGEIDAVARVATAAPVSATGVPVTVAPV